jgi:hypothetical protein
MCHVTRSRVRHPPPAIQVIRYLFISFTDYFPASRLLLSSEARWAPSLPPPPTPRITRPLRFYFIHSTPSHFVSVNPASSVARPPLPLPCKSEYAFPLALIGHNDSRLGLLQDDFSGGCGAMMCPHAFSPSAIVGCARSCLRVDAGRLRGPARCVCNSTTRDSFH